MAVVPVYPWQPVWLCDCVAVMTVVVVVMVVVMVVGHRWVFRAEWELWDVRDNTPSCVPLNVSRWDSVGVSLSWGGGPSPSARVLVSESCHESSNLV